jgi:hypothetical protein
MMDEPQTVSHWQCEALVELALGVLDRREQAALLDHVASCARCSVELERWMATATSLFLIMPEVDPPADFETRLSEQMSLSSLKSV